MQNTGNYQMQEKPMFPPPHPKFVTGSCEVHSKTTDASYHVDLDEMVCECPHGAAWRWDNKRWKPNTLCAHKLKAVASLCQHNPDDETLRQFYEESVGKRFNAFEAISAMHKELRRGDADAALYWATAVIPHRGRHGVLKYLRSILFEETRDINLARYLVKVSSRGTSIKPIDFQRAVVRFAHAPKKWHLPWRKALFIDEMKAYKKLGENYGYQVARGGDAVPADQEDHLRSELIKGFASGDRVKVQYGVKGWYKMKSPDHDHLKIDIWNFLIEVSDNDYQNAFEYDELYVEELYEVIMRKMRNHGGIRYHDINAFTDALCGEPGHNKECTLSSAKHKKIINNPKEYRLPLGDLRKVPLYAHDNHTWGGKAKMRSHRNQLDPGAKQTDLDFRICGAYMGVGWRYLAYEQHATIDCKWGDVKWHPKWLWPHLDKMWY